MSEPWYTLEEVKNFVERENVPIGLTVWLTRHLNLAFEKGKQIGTGETEAAIHAHLDAMNIPQVGTAEERVKWMRERVEYCLAGGHLSRTHSYKTMAERDAAMPPEIRHLFKASNRLIIDVPVEPAKEGP